MRSDRATALFLAILLPGSAHAMRIAPLHAYASVGRGAVIERVVDQDRVDGSLKKLKGSAKETFGKVTGDRKMQSQAAREKAAGKVQNAIGGFKDSVREVIGK